MLKDIYDPLTEYVTVFRDRFRDVAEKTFTELVEDAKIDITANRETCRQVYATEKELFSTRSHISSWKTCHVLLWLVIAGGLVAIFTSYQELELWAIIAICVGVIIALLFLLLKIYPLLRKLQEVRDHLETNLAQLKSEAWEQMSPLNHLYDWDVLTRMMSQTVPRLEFDPYFTTQRLADLKMTYGWDDFFNEERSVVYSHSGLINGNPFVLCRTKKMEMGQKTYYGTKTIHWTTSERGSDGKYHTVHHSQTLTASVTAPYPNYYEKTHLFYGNTAAPDLIFSRRQSGLASKEGSWTFRKKLSALRKKARNLEKADFAMLTNETFEVAFDTSNRNNNQQFALLFTPLAQESILKLLKDKTIGFGDDFDFYKNKMINTIVPSHIQKLNLDMNPNQYQHFDYEKAKEEFYTVNAYYFRAIYFCLAPLLCIPMYQQIRPQHDIYGHDMQPQSAFWEHEALANFWGTDKFKHPSCVTDCILKTKQRKEEGDNSTIFVSAHGYRTEQRVTYVRVWGGDGRYHNVPVYWDEYLSVVGNGQIQIKEDNEVEESSITHRQRLNRIHKILNSENLQLYRRHIASRV